MLPLVFFLQPNYTLNSQKSGHFCTLTISLTCKKQRVSQKNKSICDKTELKFPSIIIRVEKPGGNLLCRELLVWCRSGPDQRSFVTPVTLSISPQCCGNTDDYLTLPKALTSNGGPFIVDQSLLDQQYNSSNIIRENKTLMVLVTLINGIHFGAQNRTGFPLVASKWKNSLLCWKISLFSTTEKYPFFVVVLFCYWPFIFQSQSQ